MRKILIWLVGTVAVSALGLFLYVQGALYLERVDNAEKRQRQAEMRDELEAFDKALAACVSEFASSEAKIKFATHLEQPYKEISVEACRYTKNCGLGESSDVAYARTETEPGFYGTPTANAIGRIADVCAEKQRLRHPNSMLACKYLAIDNPEFGERLCESYLPEFRAGRETVEGFEAKSRLFNRKFNSADLSADQAYSAIVRRFKEDDTRIERSMQAHAKYSYEARAREAAAQSAWALKSQ